ncbi:MAG: SPFH domain-containing protein [Clostridia bacterium]|nr:SPFH domain-containing protein [Clostridia bacterium]MBQ6867030.1 SPFH domain-containing protein [Clostridia bacterium]MBR0421613.1 SPFH domain-containing protein [Clostridia bacterium]
MGLIQAVGATLTTVLADQWREYFYCDSLPENVLMRRGVKRTNGKSSNTRGSDNIISNGSIIAVNDGQCMMIVDQGGIVEFTAQPGEFVWDKSTEPSIFYGSLGENLKKTWEVLKKRFTFGGDTAKDQRVYYFNIKEIVGNKYGTANPVGFRVYYPNINLDTEIGIRCFGEYSYKLTDPMLFYKNVAANVSGDYTRDRIDSQLKSEFLTALQPAFAKISDMGIRYSALPGHTMELADSMNAVLSPKWAELRGISIVSVGVSSVNANPEDEERIKKLQNAAASTYGTMVVGEALQGAASNENGAMMGFMGMNMAGNMANNVTGGQGGGFGGLHMYQPSAQPATPAAAPAGWTCPKCGKTGNTGKFCAECGEKKPEEKKGWTCPKCGTVNLGKFCQECGEKKPADAPLYKCDKCGWEPEDPAHPPKFCPECGDPFTDDDIVK